MIEDASTNVSRISVERVRELLALGTLGQQKCDEDDCDHAVPAFVVLEVQEGDLDRARFAFGQPATVLMGRSPDCDIRIPSDGSRLSASRRHCLLEIDPPHVRIADLGSRNGTLVNGVEISERKSVVGGDDAVAASVSKHDLKDGDEITIASTTLRVRISPFVTCSQCRSSIPLEDQSHVLTIPEKYVCESCRASGKQDTPKP
jgi:eukaryotic-like serine/threonine-protein kinase